MIESFIADVKRMDAEKATEEVVASRVRIITFSFFSASRLEREINTWLARGYRLITMSFDSDNSGRGGLYGGAYVVEFPRENS